MCLLLLGLTRKFGLNRVCAHELLVCFVHLLSLLSLGVLGEALVGFPPDRHRDTLKHQ